MQKYYHTFELNNDKYTIKTGDLVVINILDEKIETFNQVSELKHHYRFTFIAYTGGKYPYTIVSKGDEKNFPNDKYEVFTALSALPVVKKEWIVTFGQSHMHTINDYFLDHDIVLVVPGYSYGEVRKRVWEMFDDQFAFMYDAIDFEKMNNIKYFPRGFQHIDNLVKNDD